MKLFEDVDDALTPYWICNEYHAERDVYGKFRDRCEAIAFLEYLEEPQGMYDFSMNYPVCTVVYQNVEDPENEWWACLSDGRNERSLIARFKEYGNALVFRDYNSYGYIS